MMATYVGAVAFLIGYFVLTNLFQKPQYDHSVGLLEPFGIGAVQDATRYWTTADRDTMLPPLGGVILANRAIWFCASFAVLTLAYFSYRFESRGARRPRPNRRRVGLHESRRMHCRRRISSCKPHGHGLAMDRAWRWLWSFRSPAFFVLLLLGLLNALASLGNPRTDRAYFTVLPVTNLMIQTLNLEFGIIPTIVAIYYAGELVWRERRSGAAM